jgi:hypothetical protein
MRERGRGMPRPLFMEAKQSVVLDRIDGFAQRARAVAASVAYQKNLYIVMPAKAGIQCLEKTLDSGSRSRCSLGRNDKR